MTITISGKGRTWDLPGEHIGTWLAVIPMSIPRDDGRQWTGSFTVAHANGMVIPQLAGCATCMRAAAAELAALDVPWHKLTADPAANARAVSEDEYGQIMQVAQKWDLRCEAEPCDHDEEAFG